MNDTEDAFTALHDAIERVRAEVRIERHRREDECERLRKLLQAVTEATTDDIREMSRSRAQNSKKEGE